MGHLAKMCRQQKVSTVKSEARSQSDDGEEGEGTYNINIFQVNKVTQAMPKYRSTISNSDFKVNVMVNNSLAGVIADTGAKVSVCGTVQAKKWGLLGKMSASTATLKPYNSSPIKVYGEARCAVTFGATSVPVVWHIISGSSEPILSGLAAVQLGIIKFNKFSKPFHPINMISRTRSDLSREMLQNVLAHYPENFTGLGKLKHYKVKLHIDRSVKPVVVPPRSVPYHLQDRFDKAIKEMVNQDVIEEHPIDEPAPWVSCASIAPKPDGAIRVTLDAKNVNKAILSTNHPIPRQEDIKAKLSGARVFSKLDFKSAYWQLELHPESRFVTVFHANDKLYRYKRLIMGVKPAQGELNVSLRPIFAHIRQAHLIHDDLVVATQTEEEHKEVIRLVMQAVSQAGLTLNPGKCFFAMEEVKFWGMIFGKDGVKPDPEKVDVMSHLTAPRNKEELNSFLCMMQSNAEFIEGFFQKSAPLRALTKKSARFEWGTYHQECFQMLADELKEETLLRYFDLSKRTFVLVDAHISGLGATLAQGDSLKEAKPIAYASRTTTDTESRYPQLDLEAMAVDFGLRRFRKYLVGSPRMIVVVTDHINLWSQSSMGADKALSEPKG